MLQIKPHETVNEWLLRSSWERIRMSRNGLMSHYLAHSIKRIETTQMLIRRSDNLIRLLWGEESETANTPPALAR